MKKIAAVLSVAGVLLLMASGAAFANKASVAIKALDPDHDGTVSLTEAEAGATRVFKALNPDHDGTLDRKELRGRVSLREIKAFDPDRDGTLDLKEYKALVVARFRAANPDHDGTVDQKELETRAGRKLLDLIY